MYGIEDGDPAVTEFSKWAKDSPLRSNWYIMAVELVGNAEANAIQANHSGGGNKECLLKLLSKWWNTTTAANRNWQVIVDALKEIEAIKVIEDITDKCSA